MPESPQIFPFTVQVTDVMAAARFYSSLFGIEGRSIRGARHYFDCGPAILALMDPGNTSARPIRMTSAFRSLKFTGRRPGE
jgi:hypothetical protein